MTLFCVLVTKWFYMQEFSLSYGMFISVGKLTNVACSYLTPVLANEKIGYASLVGLIIMTLSAISGYIFTLFEKHAVKIENLEFFSQSIVEEKYSLRGIIKLGTQYWFLTFNVTLGYIGFYSFETISQDFLLQRYWIPKKSSTIIGKATFLAIPLIFSPIFGFIADRFGRKVTLITISTFISSISYALLLIFKWSDDTSSYIGVLLILMLGFSFCIYVVTIWTLIPIVVNPNSMGTALGIAFFIQSLAFTIYPIIADKSKLIKNDGKDKYQYAVILFMALFIIATLLNLTLYAIDKITIRKVQLRSRNYRKNLISPSRV